MSHSSLLPLRMVWAFLLFGRIFLSYMSQLALISLAGRYRWSAEWLEKRKARLDLENARRLRRSLPKLRGVYIKFGQVLSLMGGFLPRVYTEELEALQDRVPPQRFRVIRRAMEASLRRPVKTCFHDIEARPIAAASLGQVHVAYLHGGRKVAVKVLYPGIRAIIQADMRIIRLALKIYHRFVPVQNLEHVHESLVDLLRRETDYLEEAANMERLGRLFQNDKDIILPEVVKEWTTRDVLTMTYVEGIKITKLKELEALGIARTRIASRLVECFYKQLFVFRFLHADPHPGNFLIQPGEKGKDFRLVILDLGAVSEIRDEVVEGLVDILQGFFERRDDRVLQGFRRIGFAAPRGNQELLERTVKMYFERLLKVKSRTAGALMRARRSDLEKLADPGVERGELRALMRSIRYPEGWFYIERAAVLLFWLAGQIDPDLDTLNVGFRYVVPLIAERTKRRAAAV